MDFNSLKRNSYSFSIERIPETIFKVVAVNLPGISVPAPVTNSAAAPQWFPGSTSEFSMMNVTFIVDEFLKNYEEIFRWITQQRFSIGDEFTIHNTTEEKLVSDGNLLLLDNASNPSRAIKFFDMFPTQLSEINFSSRDSDHVECTVSFYYSRFIFQK